MEKIEARSVIKFLHLKGYSVRQIHDEMKAVHGDDCPSYDTVVRWKRNFQTGHMSLTDESRTGRPSLTDSAATVKKVEDLILKDGQVTFHVIMHETELSYGSVWKIIYDELYMSKVSVHWVPRLLTLRWQTWRDLSRQMLTLLEQDEEDFFGRLVTMNETKSIYYLAKGQTITSAYYCTLLNKLRDALKKKRRGMLTKGVRLLADNAPAHSSQAAVVKTRRCGYETLPHQPYSPFLTPSGFFLYSEMKNPMRGRRFDDTEDVIQEMKQWFSTQSEDFYNSGLRKVKK
ncbi:histone-lysine N-methyltransferase SETMAR-like [Oratosquilla oratoria]|uniref:histone-lysine N-methyltransferase SETMAR-like n=1 Tax=Oratosquilla oratoria TaxID=337810 RepID=UPI003F76DB44